MIATMDSMELLDQADVLSKMIANSEVSERYHLSKDKLNNDPEAQNVIHKFVTLKEKYDEVQRFGKYHPDYNQVIKDMMAIKRDVDLNDTISAYQKSEDELEELLNEVSLLIARSVSESIKVPSGNPFFDKKTGGGCGTGGACGCG